MGLIKVCGVILRHWETAEAPELTGWVSAMVEKSRTVTESSSSTSCAGPVAAALFLISWRNLSQA